MSSRSLAYALCATLLFSPNVIADQILSVGVFCVTVESVKPVTKPLRVGQRPPQLSFEVSNRSKVDGRLKRFAVVPLNEDVYRSLTTLTPDARICLAASHMAIRHGLDILFTWRLETCTDVDCTNVRGADDFVAERSDRETTRANPRVEETDPSDLDSPLPDAREEEDDER